MSTVVEIIEAVKQLSKEEKGEFLTRLAEVNFDDAWIVRLRLMLKLDDSIRFGRKQFETYKKEASNLSMTSSATPSFWRAHQSLQTKDAKMTRQANWED